MAAMSQTFIVLRHDQQLGPYTLEQLSGIGLRPDDMIWVEGQSAAWQRAQVVPQLKNFPFGAGTTAISVTPTPKEEPIYFPEAGNRKKPSAANWIVVAVLILLLGAGAWMIFKPSAVSKPVVSETPDFTASDSSLAATGDSVQLTSLPADDKPTSTAAPDQIATKEKRIPSVSQTGSTTEADAAITDVPDTDASPVSTQEAEVEQRTETTSTGTAETTTDAKPAEKKKTVLEKVDDWVQNNEVLGPQKKAVEKDVTDAVKVHLRISSDEFMLGVRNGQVVLQNNSGMKLRSAKTEVVYYDGKGEVLDRKTVSFGAVAIGATVTAAAPDHRTAERAGVVLLSATGIGRE